MTTTKISPDLANIASQAKAEAGTATDKFMTPQRTAQAVSALGFSASTGSDGVLNIKQESVYTLTDDSVAMDIVIKSLG